MMIIATYRSLMQAEITKERLEVNGIKAWIADEAAYTSGYGFASSEGARVAVAEEDYDRALRVLAEEPINLPEDIDTSEKEPVRMSLHEELVAEIRSLSRTVQHATVILLIGLFLVCFYISFKFKSGQRHSSTTWRDVTEACNNLDYAKAATLASSLTRQNPQNYYGYDYLAYIQLCQGDLTHAAVSAERAYELFPTEENRDRLMAVRKLLDKKQ
jgi:cytochrome c-type biogenesis protein CcmH/NrfG